MTPAPKAGRRKGKRGGRAVASCAIVLVDLSCEYRRNPVGLHEVVPRLGWIAMAADPSARGVRQTAYQIEAATSPAKLAKKPDLWDTGRVESDRSIQVEYAGKRLASGMDVYWRVRAWDQDGVPSPWSETARWTMGLLGADDWEAKWLAAPDPLHFARCAWVWHQLDAADAGSGRVCFQKVVQVPARGSRVARAAAFLSAKGALALFVNGREVGRAAAKDGIAGPTLIELGDSLNPGANVVSIVVEDATDGTPGALAGKLVVRHADQRQDEVAVDPSWRCGWVGTAARAALAQEHCDWPAAVRVGGIGHTNAWAAQENAWGVPGSPGGIVLPPPAMFRAEFRLKSKPVRALVHATALGAYELRLNGAKVGDDFLTPGWSDYDKRVYANSYDVTAQLCEGRNAVGATLADGWYAGHVAWGRRRDRHGTETRLMVQLDVEYADGTRETVASGNDWKATTDGPWREADLLMGTAYDARTRAGRLGPRPDSMMRRGNLPCWHPRPRRLSRAIPRNPCAPSRN